MTQARCMTCPRPVPDTAYGCQLCARDLAGRLDELAALLPEIGVTVAKLDRIGAGGARAAGAEVPLPYRDAAGDRGRAIQGELVTWSRVVLAETGRRLVGNTGSALCRFLGEVADWARYQQFWPELYAALRPLAGRALGLVDRPADKVYLGPCQAKLPDGDECEADVMAVRGAAKGKCRQCGAVHDVAKSREWLLKALTDHLARPVEIAGVLRQFGDAKVGYSTIAAYVATGQLVPHGQDGHGRALFRIGDVLELRLRLAKRATRRDDVVASTARQS